MRQFPDLEVREINWAGRHWLPRGAAPGKGSWATPGSLEPHVISDVRLTRKRAGDPCRGRKKSPRITAFPSKCHFGTFAGANVPQQHFKSNDYWICVATGPSTVTPHRRYRSNLFRSICPRLARRWPSTAGGDRLL